MLAKNPALAGRIPALDGIRGLAILMIVIYHYVPLSSVGHPSMRLFALLLKYGSTGVDLFFVLSGFLISGILLDSRHDPKYFRVFYTRRSLRILPLYFAVLLTFAVCSRLIRPIPAFQGDLPVWPYCLLIQNIVMAFRQSFGAPFMVPTWSLAVEEQFYLCLPLVIHKVNSKRVMWLIVAALIALPPLVRFAWTGMGYSLLGTYVLLPARADALGFGVAIAVLVRDRKCWEILLARPWLLYAAGLAVVLPGTLLLAKPLAGSAFNPGIGYSIVGAGFALFLLFALMQHARHRKSFLTWKPLVWFGSVSYAVYLLHYGLNAVAHNLFDRGTGSPLPSLLALAVTLILAEASRRWFEGPILKRAHSYQYTSGRSSIADAASSNQPDVKGWSADPV